MTTNHHTAIATGAAANASTINSPLSELDTQITTNATDITTHQSVLVSIPMPNLFEDPFNLLLDPVSGWPGADLVNRNRWMNSSFLSRVDPDASNPFGAPTIRMTTAGSGAGRFIFFDEAGIKVGDVITFSVYANSSGGDFSLNVDFYDSGDLVVSSTEGTHTAFSGTTQKLVLQATVPATATYARLHIDRNDGSTDFDVYYWGCVMGQRSDPQLAPGRMVRWFAAPASASADGVLGMTALDANYLYVCTATDTWKRVAIATW